MAIKSLLAKDIKKLNNSINNAINYVDIDYDVKRDPSNPWTTKTRSTICRNDYAILNAYRLWLQSKRYDYVRAPDFGGLFENNLNDRVYFSPDNEEAVRQIVIEESAIKWPDITVLECHVTAIVQRREWLIRIVAQDKGTRLVLTDENLIIPVDN